jgi:hypothetical protein
MVPLFGKSVSHLDFPPEAHPVTEPEVPPRSGRKDPGGTGLPTTAAVSESAKSSFEPTQRRGVAVREAAVTELGLTLEIQELPVLEPGNGQVRVTGDVGE